ncbi:multiheme c-type cytochrome [Qingshengfaniella alkalisoli]|uniref:Tetratricopeptide repeat protein n=1 Tax=Qingshengfaniella alkalisoli TaxID=2599296 RepID=A0A5B8JBU3_9RHOB|nr:multiheme c-type cytochrome [Qingshengfaniella alkalisoli]QDY71570.1 tetratricopeptide repeat protein [Qingshengfaniella alkalisoli]
MKPTRLFLALSYLASPLAAQEIPSRYIGSEQCADCHVSESEAWEKSHHALAWTKPTADSIVADFDGTRFEGNGMRVQFSEDEDGFHAKVMESDGSQADYNVHSVVGIEPLQQYLFETEPGRLQSFDVVWDDDRKEWYHLYEDTVIPPNDGLHWSGPYKNWNARCAECHATGFQKNYDADTDSYASTQVEIGVGCEACHGPGSSHIEWVKTQAPVDIEGLDRFGFSMARDAGTEAWIQQCAGCHSRREAFGDGNPMPGTPYHDAYRLSLLTPDLYHPDGQIMEEVYVYGSFLQSKMYEQGVGCGNCHDPHTAQVLADDNSLCTQCHSPAGNTDFPTLPLQEFDDPSHHFHEQESEGAQCRNCHMVEQVYMGIDERADHSFRIPRPDLAAKTGAPDACTSCHTEKPAEWAAEKVAEWYPESVHRGSHFGVVFAQAENDPAAAQQGLLDVAQNENASDIVRATSLYLLERAADPEIAGATEAVLTDDSPLLRAGAASLQRAAGPQTQIPNLLPLLNDPVRTVRFAAARQLLGAPIAHLPETVARSLRGAMGEWQNSLSNRLDFPETHLVMGGTALTLRNFPAALEAFKEAVALDPQRVDAWSMVVRLQSAMGNAEAAETSVKAALNANPDNPMLQDFARQLGIQ